MPVRKIFGRGFNSRRLHQDLIQHNPKKYKNPLEITGFLLSIVLYRPIKSIDIPPFLGYILGKNTPMPKLIPLNMEETPYATE